MPKRRKKKIVRIIHPSHAPLPARLAPRFAEQAQVFSDASLRRHGGLAAVLFETSDSEALIYTKTVALAGSNELELQAVLFAVKQATERFPGRPLALFSDNQDAVNRLLRAKEKGIGQDEELAQMLKADNLPPTLENFTFCWIKGHGTCRGNLLADFHAAEAAR